MTSHKDLTKRIDLEIPDVADDEYIYKISKSKFTLNKYGKMSLSENPQFRLIRKMMDKSKPVLEIGCAYGFTCKILLKDGFSLIANDLEKKHLEELESSIENEDEKKRLILQCGNMLDLDYAENSLSGIICLNVMHFLTGEQTRVMFNRFQKWLTPGGLLLISTASPYFFIYGNKKVNRYEKFKEFYMNMRAKKMEWPGEMERSEVFDTNDKAEKMWLKYGPDKINVLSAELLAREAVLACFHIFKLEHFEETENGFNESSNTDRVRVASMICIKEDI